jgi:hypothetical protein
MVVGSGQQNGQRATNVGFYHQGLLLISVSVYWQAFRPSISKLVASAITMSTAFCLTSNSVFILTSGPIMLQSMGCGIDSLDPSDGIHKAIGLPCPVDERHNSCQPILIICIN